MKKLFSILGVIGLTATSTTSLISCEKPNNNENRRRNKPEPTPEPEQRQKPPVESNWKLITDYNLFVFNKDNKFYFFVFQPFNSKQWKILKFKHDTDFAKEINGIPFIPSDIKTYFEAGKLKGLYHWESNNDNLKIPNINKNTGKILGWKG